VKKPTIFFAVMMMSACAFAQETHTQSLYWLRYQNQLIFSPQVYWTNEFDNRRFIDPDVENQFIMHSRVHYKKGPWDFATGITYSLAYAAIPENGFKEPIDEIRPVIEASYEIPIGKIFLANRVRIDNRFFQEDPDQSVFEESFYVLRFRYRLQLRMPLKVNDNNITTIGLRVADEIMFNNKENTYDQNRVYVAGEFYLNKNFSVECQYILIHQQRYGTEDFFLRNVIRFSILHRVFVK